MADAVTDYVSPDPGGGTLGGRSARRLRREMLGLIIALARSEKPPRYAGVRLAAAAKAIDAIDAELARLPVTKFVESFGGDAAKAFRWVAEHRIELEAELQELAGQQARALQESVTSEQESE